MKIGETDDPSIAIIFDSKQKLYLGKKEGSQDLPLLKDEQVLPLLPVVRVDSGAVKFVCNGATIMRPGITTILGAFDRSALVVIREEKYDKAIAVGRALVEKNEMEGMSKGQAIENLHYVGDKYWEALKELQK